MSAYCVYIQTLCRIKRKLPDFVNSIIYFVSNSFYSGRFLSTNKFNISVVYNIRCVLMEKGIGERSIFTKLQCLLSLFFSHEIFEQIQVGICILCNIIIIINMHIR